MNGYNFTERVRKVLAMAREEAARLHHEYVGTEHILLGLIREGEGVAAVALQNLDVDLDEIHDKIEKVVAKGKAAQTTGPDLPYTSRAKKVLELAMAEARSLNHAYVGTEHLLLGLIAERQGVAAQVLAESGITLDTARASILDVLGTEAPNYPDFKHQRTFGRAVEMPRSSAPTHMFGYLPIEGPTALAASIIQALLRDPAVAETFAAQGIDAHRLIAALRAAAYRAPPDNAPGASAGDSPSEPPSSA